MSESTSPEPASSEALSLDTDLDAIAAATAEASRAFLTTVTEVAVGSNPDTAIALLLLASADLGAAGARLGAIHDVVPATRFEPDAGPEVETHPLRQSLANLFESLDTYFAVVDPLVSAEVEEASLASGLADIATALSAGLQHYEAGNVSEALWWWQYSYLASWGEECAEVNRALLNVIGHLRLDVDPDVALEAQIDALVASNEDTES